MHTIILILAQSLLNNALNTIFFYFISKFTPPISSPLHTTFFFFFLNDTAPPEIYPLPLHDALPISNRSPVVEDVQRPTAVIGNCHSRVDPQVAVEPRQKIARSIGPPLGLPAVSVRFADQDRKSTRLNSSHT